MSEKGKKGTQQGGKGKGGKSPVQEEKVADSQPEAKQEKKQEKKVEPKPDVVKAPITEEVKKEETKAPTPTLPKKEFKNSPAGEKKKKEETKRETGKGVVKAVLSGDTVVVINLSKNQSGPPTEKIISLSGISAPQLGRRKTEEKEAVFDKPFAWQSREFLRQKLIGKQVAYIIETKTEKKEYGVIFLDNESIIPDIIANGWAKVRRPPAQVKEISQELDDLIKLEETAQKAEKGIFNKNEEVIKSSVRPFNEVNPTELFTKLKGKPQTGVIEQVRSGNTLKIVLVPSYHEIILILSGVDCPSARPKDPEQFGREARFFTEHHLLNREVSIILEGADKYNFYGTVSYLNRYVAEELLKEGLGRYVDWSGSRSILADRLKEAENQAKLKRLRLWQDWVSPKPLSRQEEKKVAKPGKEITGKVIEVANAGCIVILDPSSNEHKIFLSSVKPPRQGAPVPSKDESKEDAIARSMAWEAKEFLRKRIISAKVRCVLDYTREVPKPASAKGKDKDKPDERNYCSVYLDKNNIAVELVEQGLATPQEHKGGEQRSRDYEHIIFAESRAKKAGKGLHAPQDRAVVIQITDISSDAKAAKQKFPFLQRHGRIRGVVEYEFSAARLKLLVPKESCQIMLTLAGVQTPMKDSPLFKTALLFTKEKCHQHDVEFEVLAQDTKGAGFIGNVWLGKQSLGCLLLEQGLAKIYRGADRDSEMIIAEDIAKRAKKNLWKDYDEAAEEAKRKEFREEHQERSKPKQEYIDVIVTEIVDGSKFFVQVVGPDAEQLEELMKNLATEESNEPHKPNKDELVKAQFSDDAWYRAKVVKVVGDDEYQVFYIDYGNSETIPSSRIRKLAPEFKTLKPQAVEAVLAYLKTPPIEDDNGKEAAEFLKELVWGKTMMANVEKRDNSTGTLHLSLGDRESQVHVNAALLRAGLAKVEKVRGAQYREMLEKLKDEETKARASHVGIWEYGDPGSDEDDDDKRGPPKRRN